MNKSAYPELIPQKIRSALFQPFPDPTYNSGMAVQTTEATSPLLTIKYPENRTINLAVPAHHYTILF